LARGIVVHTMIGCADQPDAPSVRTAGLGILASRALGWLLGVVLSLGLLASPQPGSITWDPREATLTAEVRQMPLREVLEHLSAQTGWQVYLDPALERTVSSRFNRLSTADALRRLFWDLNFSLRPRAGLAPELYVYSGSAVEATLLITPSAAASSDLLAEEWVVRLKPDAAESIEDIARRHGASVVGKAEGLDIYRLRFEDAAAASQARQSLESDPQIAAIEQNYQVRPPHQTADIGQHPLPSFSLKPRPVTAEEGVIVALLDTAVAVDSPGLRGFLLPTLGVTEGVGPTPETLTHGTAMAETLLRSLALHATEPGASAVRILPIDVYGDQPTTSTFDLVNGLLVAAHAGANVVNLSLGSEGASPLLQDTIRALRNAGVLVIAAAGNVPTDLRVFPAAYPEVLAVTAGDAQGNVAHYANYGEFVDLLGPGTSLVQFDNRVYRGTGTSYATAHISGAAAAYLATGGGNPVAVDALLRQHYGYRAPDPAVP
jgi:hypothetical protein